jgi:rfaE bifunctional protein kinase chain/domain
MSSPNFFDILARAKGKRVAVVGDFMLDRHIIGTVKRISPEAPVPVVEIDDERSSLGGAGNVVANLASLGIQPVAFGVSGTDHASVLMREHLSEFGCDCGGLLELSDRKTTEKIRVIAHDQHVVRVDRETASALEAASIQKLLNAFESFLSTLDGVILQDYNKGVLASAVIEGSLKMASKRGLPVYVDPKFDNFLLYQNVHLFKPNLRETERALGLKIEDDNSLTVALENCSRRYCRMF